MESPEKIFAVGDIHGCADKLSALVDKIDLDPVRDLLVFIGDYVDRGPASYEVVDFLIDLKTRVKNVVFIKGNHEDMLLKYLSGHDRFTYLMNGGQSTLDSYLKRKAPGMRHPIPKSHLAFYDSLILYHETPEFLFVHAGIRKQIPLERQDTDDLLWIRSEFIKSDYDFKKRVVFGHTPFRQPLVMPNKIGIDTGAVYGNKLTCVKLPDMVFYQV
ncbi:MAG: serine/threonine protein phosphatase [Deltaproteobacteria bacterium]|nr:serine/threonine protein phosphatase [Deltaproteobacteria bacterium]MBW1954499.1 serine/threonine protein phosphatase [Deltaproteobacteria bacterium]MBW2041713.1 serine/threonine protein phosphatase [Deltaproteobacteria bacterium]MBW2131046.1 serine/threonine protein phosphatase [Deltaproteobacteria bacterium]